MKKYQKDYEKIIVFMITLILSYMKKVSKKFSKTQTINRQNQNLSYHQRINTCFKRTYPPQKDPTKETGEKLTTIIL